MQTYMLRSTRPVSCSQNIDCSSILLRSGLLINPFQQSVRRDGLLWICRLAHEKSPTGTRRSTGRFQSSVPSNTLWLSARSQQCSVLCFLKCSRAMFSVGHCLNFISPKLRSFAVPLKRESQELNEIRNQTRQSNVNMQSTCALTSQINQHLLFLFASSSPSGSKQY